MKAVGKGQERGLTRRRFLLNSLAAAASGSVLLNACSDDGETPVTGETASPESAFPVTIEHARGSTVIETAPTNAVSLGYSDQDPMLALGVVPVGIRVWLELFPNEIAPWQEPALGGATPTTLGFPIPFEQVAALQPDLIVAVYEAVNEQQYARLSRLAPTVAHDPDFVDYGTPWEAMHRVVAQALGRSEEMEDMISDVEAQLATLAEEHPEFEGKTGLVLSSGFGDESQFGVYGGEDPRVRILSSLGLETPPAVEAELDKESFFTWFSIERLSLLDEADVLLWLPYAERELDYISDNPIYQGLDVVQAGGDIIAPFDVGAALSFASVLSIPYALERLVPALSAAVDGDPATTAA
jgi:iron complex transport system substrate-binding protein